MSTDLLELTIREAAYRVRQKEVTFPELLDAALARIRATESLVAFIHIDEDQARAVAASWQQLLEAGYDLGPLQGIPIGIKDNVDVQGTPTRFGSEVYRERIPSSDATVVRRLRQSGAVFAGMTNMHEFAWGGTTDNPHYGTCRNPWNVTRSPGGSSGGTGAAVASRSIFAGLGTDTGGSIRLPSAMNGITGIRPTWGGISNNGVLPVAWTMDTVGPMAKSAEDCLLIVDAIAGRDIKDPTTSTADILGRTQRKQTKKLGIVTDYSLTGNQMQVQQGVRNALKTFEDELGYEVLEFELPGIEHVVEAQIVIDGAEPSALHDRELEESWELFGEDVRRLLTAGHSFSAVDYVAAQRYRSMLSDSLAVVLRHVDAVITPTLPFTAPEIGATKVEIEPGVWVDKLFGNMRYTALPSMTGTPAVSVPVGIADDGLPVGVQVIGEPGDDRMLLKLCADFQHFNNSWSYLPYST